MLPPKHSTVHIPYSAFHWDSGEEAFNNIDGHAIYENAIRFPPIKLEKGSFHQSSDNSPPNGKRKGYGVGWFGGTAVKPQEHSPAKATQKMVRNNKGWVQRLVDEWNAIVDSLTDY